MTVWRERYGDVLTLMSSFALSNPLKLQITWDPFSPGMMAGLVLGTRVTERRKSSSIFGQEGKSRSCYHIFLVS